MTQDEALSIMKTGCNVYLTGQAGAGKTYVLNQYIAYLREKGIPVAVTASTGIAATHIGGMTIHSWSGIGVRQTLTEMELDALTQKRHLWKRFEKTRVLIIDEVSMLSAATLDTIDAVCRALKREDAPFGGMQVVLSGDFFQLPPVARGGEDVRFVYRSRAWSEAGLRICYLTGQYRSGGDTLSTILNEMREGALSTEARAMLLSRRDAAPEEDAVMTRLYTHNVDVDRVNDTMLEEADGSPVCFTMSSGGNKKAVESLKKSIITPETLRLKRGAFVMCTKNNPEAGYMNGTLGTVVDFEYNDMPVIKTLAGDEIRVTSVRWEVVDEEGKQVAYVEQLPLRLAWAITVHKSQGMSLDAAEVDLSKSFVEGQGYVALSRLRTLSGLRLLGVNDIALRVNREVVAVDKTLRKQSEDTRARFVALPQDKKALLHQRFAEKNADDSVQEGDGETKEEKVPTHRITAVLFDQGLTVEEIAHKRSVTVGTILSHLEKLKTLGEREFSYADNLISEESAKKIIAAFKETKTTNLTPVHKLLGGVYTYEEIRKARLLL